jgi:fumarylacetoacetase
VAIESWVPVPPMSPFPVTNLPYGATDAGVVVAIGDVALDAGAAARATRSAYADALSRPTLDGVLALGPEGWSGLRAEVTAWLTDDSWRPVVEPHLHPQSGLELRLPFTVADYVDFYASEQHAANLGRMLRPGQPALLPNWRHLPVGYHGRSGTVVVSGTPIRRPSGQRRGDDAPVFGPSERLDIETEVGFVVGAASTLGEPVPVDGFAAHVFGVCLVNDWSARDIQAWEYQPLGPFLGKSFATSISAWLVPLDALQSARVWSPSAQSPLLPYLREREAWGLDIRLEVRVNGELVSRPPYRSMHWSPAQMLAHLTVNGASVRAGDLYASGTVSGPRRQEWGSLIELWDNARFLADGDEVVISATAPGPEGTTVGFGEVRGTVAPAASAGSADSQP